MIPNVCKDMGHVKDPTSGRTYTRFKLAPGWAFHLVNGEWIEEKVTPGAISSSVDTDRIQMIRGRACCIFTVLGQDQFAQPITGVVSPAVERAEKRFAKLAKHHDTSAIPLKPTVTEPPPPTGPSKAALKLAKMRAHLSRGGA